MFKDKDLRFKDGLFMVKVKVKVKVVIKDKDVRFKP